MNKKNEEKVKRRGKIKVDMKKQQANQQENQQANQQVPQTFAETSQAEKNQTEKQKQKSQNENEQKQTKSQQQNHVKECQETKQITMTTTVESEVKSQNAVNSKLQNDQKKKKRNRPKIANIGKNENYTGANNTKNNKLQFYRSYNPPEDFENDFVSFYSNKIPEMESTVVVRLHYERNTICRRKRSSKNKTIITDEECEPNLLKYVSLLEYSNMKVNVVLPLQIRKHLRLSIHEVEMRRNVVIMVLYVKYSDLRQRRINIRHGSISPDDVYHCIVRYKKAKLVDYILRHLSISSTKKYTLQYLYESIGWPLYERYGHAMDAFQLLFHQEGLNRNCVLDQLNITDELKVELLSCITCRLSSPLRKRMRMIVREVRSYIEVRCYSVDGIDTIRNAFTAGINAAAHTTNWKENDVPSTTSCDTSAFPPPIQIKIEASPLYVMIVKSVTEAVGVSILNTAAETIKNVIMQSGGSIDIKIPPKVFPERIKDCDIQFMINRVSLFA